MGSVVLLVIALLCSCWSVCCHNFVSNVFGDNMVLQRAPYRASVWGWTAKPSVDVKLTIGLAVHLAKSASDSSWIIHLAPTAASGPFNMTVVSGAGDHAEFQNVMFGDVWLCTGQSNMEFTLIQGLNGTQEIQEASRFPNIRLFTVGQSSYSDHPLSELDKIEQPWSVGSSLSAGGAAWSHFSAVCWLFAKNLMKRRPDVPLGMISTNWGGTKVQYWMSPDALAQCNTTSEITPETPPKYGPSSVRALPGTPSILWNAMIVPFLKMRVRGAIWYQGESNVGQDTYYECAFPAMITDWRKKFNLEPVQFPFFFVQLAAYTEGAGSGTQLAQQRISQTAALKLPFVGMGTAIDLGDLQSQYGNIHPRDKQDVAYRLFLAASAMTDGNKVQYTGPTFKSMKVISNAPQVEIQVEYEEHSLGSGLVMKSAACPSSLAVADCAWFDVKSSDGQWRNATTQSIGSDNTVTLKVTLPSNVTPCGVRYAYGKWPVCTIYNKEGLPATPFYHTICH